MTVLRADFGQGRREVSGPGSVNAIPFLEFIEGRFAWLRIIRRNSDLGLVARLVAHELAESFWNRKTGQCNPFNNPSSVMTTSPRPGRQTVDSRGDWEAANAPSGSGGGGGRSAAEFEAAIEATQRQIAALELEAAAFLAAADAGGDYATMTEYAAKRAELLLAAQSQGLKVTPELTAQIDAQAEAYAAAGLAAEEASTKVDQIRQASEKGRDALGKVFDAILEGSESAKEAIASLLMEIAKVQFRKAMLGIIDAAGGSGLYAGLGKLLSFDGGGYTGNGPRSGGLDGRGGFLAMMHPRETVTDHTSGSGAGSSSQERAISVDVRMFVDQDGNWRSEVAKISDNRIGAAAPALVRQSVQATGSAMRRTKGFGN